MSWKLRLEINQLVRGVYVAMNPAALVQIFIVIVPEGTLLHRPPEIENEDIIKIRTLIKAHVQGIQVFIS